MNWRFENTSTLNSGAASTGYDAGNVNSATSDGGSSLGGIPESIEALSKDQPEVGKKLAADFKRLNTANTKDERKKIAKDMADKIP